MFEEDHRPKLALLTSIIPTTEILRRKVIDQAASMLLDRLASKKRNFVQTIVAQNSNAFTANDRSIFFDDSDRKSRKHRHRSRKCHSWLDDRRFNSDSMRFSTSNFDVHSTIAQPFQFIENSMDPVTFSSNALNELPSSEMPILNQRMMLIQKRRMPREYFLSRVRYCSQDSLSPNHFYAFDRMNLQKLQHHLDSIDDIENPSQLKRKHSMTKMNDSYSCDCQDIEPKKRQATSSFLPTPLETADHISLNRYVDKVELPSAIDPNNDHRFDHDKTEPSSEPNSQLILDRLEKILNLCGELRSLAKDVEEPIDNMTISDENRFDQVGILPVNHSESEPTVININVEFDTTLPDIQVEESKLIAKENVSVHTTSDQSNSLMPTESFKTISPLRPTLGSAEDICQCYLESLNSQQPLNSEQEKYLQELTKAYLLGREHALRQLKQDEAKTHSTVEFDSFNNNSPINEVPTSNLLQRSNSTFVEASTENELDTTVNLKQEVFLNQPIGIKSTQVLPGIGAKYKHQLAQCGFSRVRRLLGFYLMIKNDQQFIDWLTTKVKISIYSAKLCTQALRTWCQTHL